MLKNISNIRLILKIYTAAALIAAAVRSPLALAFVPIVLLVWFLYQWRWPLSQLIDFLTQFFLFFAVCLLFSPLVGPYFALLIALPLIVLIDLKLRDIGRVTLPDESSRKRTVSNIGLVTISLTVALIIVGLVVWSVPLLLAAGVIVLYLGWIAVVIWRRLPAAPITVETLPIRVIAGREVKTELLLKRNSYLNGMLFLKSPYPWFKAAPNAFIPVASDEIRIQVALTPPLAGPAELPLNACVIDPWGLSQVKFEINSGATGRDPPSPVCRLPGQKIPCWLQIRPFTAGLQRRHHQIAVWFKAGH